MTFVDVLNSINGSVDERIQFTCDIYIKKIIDIIHREAEMAAQVKSNHIRGYLSKIGTISVSEQNHGFNLHY